MKSLFDDAAFEEILNRLDSLEEGMQPVWGRMTVGQMAWHCQVPLKVGIANKPPKKKGNKPGEAPVKVCENCFEIVHLSATECPACGEPFVKNEPEEKPKLHDDDIMGEDTIKTMPVKSWFWSRHVSRKSGKDMLKLQWRSRRLTQPSITEYLAVKHDGYAGQKAMEKVRKLVNARFKDFKYNQYSLTAFSSLMNQTDPPEEIEYEKNGNFYNVKRIYETTNRN